MLKTNQKGAIAEGERYDMILGVGERLVRVQRKWAVRRGDVVSVRCYSSRRTATGFVKRQYTAAEIDAIAAYCPDIDCCYFLPIEEFPTRARDSASAGADPKQPAHRRQLGRELRIRG